MVKQRLPLTSLGFSRTLSVESATPTKRGGFIVVDQHGLECCRHRTHQAAEKCSRFACSQRYSSEVRQGLRAPVQA